jgi:hypothetical protein
VMLSKISGVKSSLLKAAIFESIQTGQAGL